MTTDKAPMSELDQPCDGTDYTVDDLTRARIEASKRALLAGQTPAERALLVAALAAIRDSRAK